MHVCILLSAAVLGTLDTNLPYRLQLCISLLPNCHLFSLWKTCIYYIFVYTYVYLSLRRRPKHPGHQPALSATVMDQFTTQLPPLLPFNNMYILHMCIYMCVCVSFFPPPSSALWTPTCPIGYRYVLIYTNNCHLCGLVNYVYILYMFIYLCVTFCPPRVHPTHSILTGLIGYRYVLIRLQLPPRVP